MKKTTYFVRFENGLLQPIKITKREFNKQTRLLLLRIEQVTDFNNKFYDTLTYQQKYERNATFERWTHRFVNQTQAAIFIELTEKQGGKND